MKGRSLRLSSSCLHLLAAAVTMGDSLYIPVPDRTTGNNLFNGPFVNSHSFQLFPFVLLPDGERAITGTITRKDHALHLIFRVSGNPASLKIPEPLDNPLRCDGLWLTTCFECFFRRVGSSAYHEVNISANGCWNVYRFSGYRTAMEEETAIAGVVSEVSLHGPECVLCCTLSLEGVVFETDILEVGVSCVLEHGNGEKSYWALSHPGRQPDFHNPEGFVLKV